MENKLCWSICLEHTHIHDLVALVFLTNSIEHFNHILNCNYKHFPNRVPKPILNAEKQNDDRNFHWWWWWWLYRFDLVVHVNFIRNALLVQIKLHWNLAKLFLYWINRLAYNHRKIDSRNLFPLWWFQETFSVKKFGLVLFCDWKEKKRFFCCWFNFNINARSKVISVVTIALLFDSANGYLMFSTAIPMDYNH